MVKGVSTITSINKEPPKKSTPSQAVRRKQKMKVQYSSRNLLDIFTGMTKKDLKLSLTDYLRLKKLAILRRSVQRMRNKRW